MLINSNFLVLPLFRWLRNFSGRRRSLLLVIAYVVFGVILELVSTSFRSSWQVQPWDPASGLHVVLLLGFGLRYTPAVFFVPVLDSLFLTQQTTLLQGLIGAPLIMLSYGAACALLLHKLRIDPRLRCLRDVVWFAVVFLIASLVIAALYLTVLAAMGNFPWSEWATKVMHEWAGEATGIAMLAPPLLIGLRVLPWQGSHVDLTEALPEIHWRWPRSQQVLKWGTAIAALLIACWAAYGGIKSEELDYTYFIFLPLVWIAVKNGFVEAALAVLLINIGSVIFVSSRVQGANTLALQFGLTAVSFTGVLLGAFVTERQDELTKRQQAEKQLEYDATHDNLTGLFNRTWFINKLRQAMERAKYDENYLFAILFFDLDRFKLVNDSLGHLVGDRLLVAVAQRLKSYPEIKEAVARFGGDEFTVFLEEFEDIRKATQIAQQLCEVLAQPLAIGEYEVFITSCIGIAPSSVEYEQPEDLIRDADIAMYRAKAQGTGQYAVFNQDMYDQIVARSRLENDLRQALPNQEFQLYYQPIVSLIAGRIIGFEALLRWQHPTQSFISPSQFIPVAEATGTILSLGNWVLKEACCQMREWQLAFPELSLEISVNLSGKQFLQPSLVEQIDQVLQESALNAERLKLEITESVVTENAQEAANTLTQLGSRGIRLAIDDFGTGYSSLSRLHTFKVDTLKIDRSFINRISESRAELEIVRAIVMLAQTLKMSVTAEGVETAAQLSTLRSLRCQEAQGYYFSRPITSQAAQELLAASLRW